MPMLEIMKISINIKAIEVLLYLMLNKFFNIVFKSYGYNSLAIRMVLKWK